MNVPTGSSADLDVDVDSADVNDKVLDSAEAESDSDSDEFGTAKSLVETLEEVSPVIVLGISNGRPVCAAAKEGTAGISGFGTGSGTADISALGLGLVSII